MDIVFANHRKVSFNIASEATYVYILRGQKLINIAKNSQLGEFLKNWSLRSNTVLFAIINDTNHVRHFLSF